MLGGSSNSNLLAEKTKEINEKKRILNKKKPLNLD